MRPFDNVRQHAGASVYEDGPHVIPGQLHWAVARLAQLLDAAADSRERGLLGGLIL